MYMLSATGYWDDLVSLNFHFNTRPTLASVSYTNTSTQHSLNGQKYFYFNLKHETPLKITWMTS